jgi:predicted DNA-binding transcriptional regulator AlpA
MSTDTSGSGTTPATVIIHARNISLSKWVNEQYPPWTELLSAHEVARLTRRHPWVMTARTILGRFPKQQRFRGRRVGWRRSQLADWLATDQNTSHRRSEPPRKPCTPLHLQKSLALECTAPCKPIRAVWPGAEVVYGLSYRTSVQRSEGGVAPMRCTVEEPGAREPKR